jgi:hypothetical protein
MMSPEPSCFSRHLKTFLWDVTGQPVALRTLSASMTAAGAYEGLLRTLFSSSGSVHSQLHAVTLRRLPSKCCDTNATAAETEDWTLLPAVSDLAGVIHSGYFLRKTREPFACAPVLSSLHLSDATPSAVDAGLLHTVLANCPNLTELTLEGVLPRTQAADATRTPILLERLRRLRIERVKCWEEPGLGVFALFRAPNVEHLAIVDMSYFDFQAYLFNQRDLYPRVRVLRLEQLGLDMAVPCFILARWFVGMPLVEELEVNNVNHVRISCHLRLDPH